MLETFQLFCSGCHQAHAAESELLTHPKVFIQVLFLSWKQNAVCPAFLELLVPSGARGQVSLLMTCDHSAKAYQVLIKLTAPRGRGRLFVRLFGGGVLKGQPRQ